MDELHPLNADPAFDFGPDAMLLFSDDGTILAANEMAASLFGVPADQMVGKNLAYFGPPGYDLGPGIRGLLRAGANAGEFRMTRGDGDIFEAEYRTRANVLPGRHLTIVRDISDRKRTEASLRSSEGLFARSFITAPAAITVVTLERGQFILANECFLAITGYWRSEVIGRTEAELGLWVDPEHAARAAALLPESPRLAPFRSAFRTKAGDKVEVMVSLSRAEVNGRDSLIAAALEIGPAG